jgi:phage shock protein PspC (stress-responsive transcriptional regulator)
MSIADELNKLEGLRQRGSLSEAEFLQAKAQLLESPPTPPAGIAAINQLRRSSKDRWLGGVCGGLALSTGLESWVWRLGFVVLSFYAGAGLLVYLLLWIFVPSE